MKIKKISTALGAALCLTLSVLVGCGNHVTTSNNATDISGNGISDNSISASSVSDNETAENDNAEESNRPDPIEYTISGNQIINFSSYDLTDTYDEEDSTLIQMNEMEVTIDGPGVTVANNQIIIFEKGTYILEGTLSDGQIYVKVADNEKVHLILRGVTLYCSNSAPIFIDNADKTVITLAEGTVNTISDSSAPLDNTANGCIFSRDDLTLNGTGTLNITANYNNGISCKNDLKIVNGTYNIVATNNALKGNDSIAILNCTMSLESHDDGMKVSNDTDPEKGYLFIADGLFEITANDDCFQTPRIFIMEGGHALVRCFGKVVNCDGYIQGIEEWIQEWN